MKIKRFYDNFKKKEVPPKNITSIHFSKRDGKADLVFYVDKYKPFPKAILEYQKVACNDFIIEVAEDEI